MFNPHIDGLVMVNVVIFQIKGEAGAAISLWQKNTIFRTDHVDIVIGRKQNSETSVTYHTQKRSKRLSVRGLLYRSMFNVSPLLLLLQMVYYSDKSYYNTRSIFNTWSTQLVNRNSEKFITQKGI